MSFTKILAIGLMILSAHSAFAMGNSASASQSAAAPSKDPVFTPEVGGCPYAKAAKAGLWSKTNPTQTKTASVAGVRGQLGADKH